MRIRNGFEEFFENGHFCLPFSKKYASTQRIGIVLAHPYENAKQWKYDSIPRRGYVMPAVNDALHHGVRKTPFSSFYT